MAEAAIVLRVFRFFVLGKGDGRSVSVSEKILPIRRTIYSFLVGDEDDPSGVILILMYMFRRSRHVNQYVAAMHSGRVRRLLCDLSMLLFLLSGMLMVFPVDDESQIWDNNQKHQVSHVVLILAERVFLVAPSTEIE